MRSLTRDISISRVEFKFFSKRNKDSRSTQEASTMAEARLAVAFQVQVTDEGIHVNIDRDAVKFVLRALVKRAKLRVKEAGRAILKRSFPATPASWIVLVAAISAARYTEHKPTVGFLGRLERGLPGYVYMFVCVNSIKTVDFAPTALS